MAHHDNSRSSRSPSKSSMASPAAWLPYTGEQRLVATKALHNRYIETHKSHDWFLRLADAMSVEKADPLQSKMFAKMYVFMRDFMPQGLTGKYAHIRGDDVMRHLLCHNEHTVSRHKVSKAADTAWREMEKWVKGGATWKEALQDARRETRHKNRRTPMCPGLHSPAGLLAVMIIAHPDPDSKFRNWIGQLQIDWMMTQPRGRLDVRHGFWKGINDSNLYTVFLAEEDREADITMLADYTRLFQHFLRCRKDMRPYLPPWAKSITLTEEPLDIEDSEPDDGDNNNNNDDENSAAHGMLAAAAERTDEAIWREAIDLARVAEPKDLQEWLGDALAQGSTELLSTWCHHWEKRMENATSFEDQLVIRSLFMESLRRLNSLFASSFAAGYMVVDMSDGVRTAREDNSDGIRVEKLPAYIVLKACHSKLTRLAEASLSAAATGVVKRLLKQQVDCILEVMVSSPFFDHWRAVLSFHTIRLQVLLHDHQEGASPEGSDTRELLFNQHTISRLQLTDWQMLSLALSDPSEALTGCQLRIFRQTTSELACDDVIDLGDNKPRSIAHQTIAPVVQMKHPTLPKLFGGIEPPARNTPPLTPRQDESALVQNTANAMHTTSSRNTSPKRPTLASVWTTSPTRQTLPGSPVLGVGMPRSQSPHKHSNPLSTNFPRLPSTPSVLAPVSSPTKEAKKSVWENRSFTGQKRPCSPDLRDPKRRLVSFTRNELAEDLQLFKDDMKAGVESYSSQVSKELDKITHALAKSRERAITDDKVRDLVRGELQMPLDRIETVCSSIQASQAVVVKEIGQFSSEVEELAKVQSGVGEMRDANTKELHAVRLYQETQLEEIQALRDNVQSLQNLAEILQTQQNSHHKDIRDLTEMLQAQKDARLKESEDWAAKLRLQREAQGKQMDDWAETLRLQHEAQGIEIKGLLAKPVPQLGQEGYLARECPAPSGCTQEVYVSKLTRAAWQFIFIMGNPDGGVGPDAEALQATCEHFPELDEQHIVSAIEHVQMQTWGYPLHEPDADEGSSIASNRLGLMVHL
ncbi:Uu.00g104740.m01.CDS01 [Anthostomella pinea]|uniref:Uu.00g104740.m01.CDS01 n=1 Tax=Anthostomella pinea TaxID=933095 RepID=A0AAI8V8Q5_9PEZI|nr:Uu.00g104740.m01.CDS01 [Anthostomella pinea]